MAPPAALDEHTNGNGVAKPLTADGIAALRAQSAPMPGGVAPSTSSDMFKSPVRFADILRLAWKLTRGICRPATLNRKRRGGIVRQTKQTATL